MAAEIPELGPEERAIVDEEEALLVRVREAVLAAQERATGSGDLRSVATLRALRDEAVLSRAEDLPAILQEMDLRQRLIARDTGARFPDLRSPYLAHLRIDEGKGARDYFLGHGTHLDAKAGIRILDFRVAPLAQIFYRYREGDRYAEEFPGRIAEGVVVVRRIVVIERGVLTRIVGDRASFARRPDGRWAQVSRDAMSLQPGGAGTAARSGVLGIGIGDAERGASVDVTALLDADQYKAIIAPADHPLLLLGTAGSGKTTVALHRLARIAALEKSRPVGDMRVVVPEEGLARLSRRLLEPLGADEAIVKTLDVWSWELAQRVFGKKARMSLAPPLVTTLKRHPALFHAFRERFSKLSADATQNMSKLRRRVGTLLSDPVFLGGVVDAAQGGIPRTAIQETVRHTMLQLADPPGKELASITDEDMRQGVDGRPLSDGTPEEVAGTMDLEDLPILLFLRAWRDRLPARGISHLVLDEAEDFSLFELFVLGKLLGESPSVTLAGDEAQQTFSSFAGWDASVATLGLEGVTTCRLPTSYRCPRPVTELARTLLGALAPEAPRRASRDGAPVGFFQFPDESHAQLFLAGALRDLLEREPRASVAVIARDEESARRFMPLVADLGDARLVLEGEFSFEPGIDVTDVDNAKGLEFDYVVVPDATASHYPDNDDARRRLHVAVTRTSHQLWVVAGGTPSPLIAGSFPEA